MSNPLAPRPGRDERSRLGDPLGELSARGRLLVAQAIIAHRRTLATVAGRYPEAAASIELDSAELLTAWHLLTRHAGEDVEVVVPPPVMPDPPAACSNCATSYRTCTENLRTGGRPCCGTCGYTATHRQNQWEAASRANGYRSYLDALPEGT